MWWWQSGKITARALCLRSLNFSQSISTALFFIYKIHHKWLLYGSTQKQSTIQRVHKLGANMLKYTHFEWISPTYSIFARWLTLSRTIVDFNAMEEPQFLSFFRCFENIMRFWLNSEIHKIHNSYSIPMSVRWAVYEIVPLMKMEWFHVHIHILFLLFSSDYCSFASFIFKIERCTVF